MPFDDLDEAAGEQDQSSGDEQDTSSDSTATTAEQTTTDAATADDAVDEPTESDPYEEPAFPFSDSKQTPVYPREDARDDFEETRQFKVERLLHDHGVKNVEGREHHDAVFRLADDHPELWARYVMEARGIDVPEDFGDE